MVVRVEIWREVKKYSYHHLILVLLWLLAARLHIYSFYMVVDMGTNWHGVWGRGVILTLNTSLFRPSCSSGKIDLCSGLVLYNLLFTECRHCVSHNCSLLYYWYSHASADCPDVNINWTCDMYMVNYWSIMQRIIIYNRLELHDVLLASAVLIMYDITAEFNSFWARKRCDHYTVRKGSHLWLYPDDVTRPIVRESAIRQLIMDCGSTVSAGIKSLTL